MKYVSVAEMIAIEKESDASGHTYPKMMEHAGRGLAEVVRDRYSRLEQKSALGLVGSGNNGGDTLVAFCYLMEWGWETTAYLVRPRPQDDPLLTRFIEAGGTLLDIASDPGYGNLIAALGEKKVLLDGIEAAIMTCLTDPPEQKAAETHGPDRHQNGDQQRAGIGVAQQDREHDHRKVSEAAGEIEELFGPVGPGMNENEPLHGERNQHAEQHRWHSECAVAMLAAGPADE